MLIKRLNIFIVKVKPILNLNKPKKKKVKFGETKAVQTCSFLFLLYFSLQVALVTSYRADKSLWRRPYLLLFAESDRCFFL